MKRKYKLTPFARLFLFLLIFLPVSYYGYKIYNGEMNVQDIRDKIERTSKTEKTTTPKNMSNAQCEEIIKLKDREIEILKNRIDVLEGK